MKIIGLTGGIACGKSTVSAELKRLGAVIVDADQIAREVVEPGQTAYREILHTFGPEVVTKEGELDRKALGEKVFRDEKLRQRLEAITHPAIEQCVEGQIESARKAGAKAVFLDVPLLFEVGWHKKCDQVWVVYVTPNIQLKRLMDRNGFTKEEALVRINAQMDLKEKVAKADLVIHNSGTIAETKQQILQAWLGL